MKADEIIKLCNLEDSHWWYAERRSILTKLVLKYKLHGKALDIGAAGGGNTQVLTANGLDATALEFDDSGIQVCNFRGVSCIQGDAREIPLEDESLDLVIAFDLLEHVVEDSLVVKEMHRTLKRGGHMFIVVPTGSDLWSSHDVAVNHVRRYDQGELRALINSQDLEILEHWSWNILLRPIVKIRRMSLRESDLNKINPFVNAVLRTLVVIERPLSTLKVKGVSEFLVARKR
jgi:SAM-dependent methyltransferase